MPEIELWDILDRITCNFSIYTEKVSLCSNRDTNIYLFFYLRNLDFEIKRNEGREIIIEQDGDVLAEAIQKVTFLSFWI